MNILRIVPYFDAPELGVLDNSGASQTIKELSQIQAKEHNVFLLSNIRKSGVLSFAEVIDIHQFVSIDLFKRILMIIRLSFGKRPPNVPFFKGVKLSINASLLPRLIVKKQINIVHVHSFNGNVYYFLKVLEAMEIKCLLTIHFGHTEGVVAFFSNNLNPKLCLLTTVSSGIKSKIESQTTTWKAKVITDGVDLSRFQRVLKNERSNNYALSGSLKNTDKVLLFAGGVTERKNPIFLIESMQFLPEHVVLWICGVGEMKKDLLNKIKFLKLEDRVYFFGWVQWSDMPKYYRQADLLCVPSKDEAFGRMFLEAAMAGTKSLTFDDLDAVQDLITIKGMRSVKRGTAKEFAKEVLHCLEETSVSKEDISQSASLFDWSVKNTNYQSIYSQIVNKT